MREKSIFEFSLLLLLFALASRRKASEGLPENSNRNEFYCLSFSHRQERESILIEIRFAVAWLFIMNFFSELCALVRPTNFWWLLNENGRIRCDSGFDESNGRQSTERWWQSIWRNLRKTQNFFNSISVSSTSPLELTDSTEHEVEANGKNCEKNTKVRERWAREEMLAERVDKCDRFNDSAKVFSLMCWDFWWFLGDFWKVYGWVEREWS
jgi:hypothetical protein